MNISATQAYFIKLGESGRWETECLSGGYMRVGFNDIPHELCAAKNWNEVKKLYLDKGGPKGNAARYTTELERFYSSPAETLWITFSDRKLWWGFAEGEACMEADLNKKRKIKNGWQSVDVKGNDLFIGEISSRLTQVRGYQGTICDVKQLKYLLRKINGEILPEVQKAKTAKTDLLAALAPVIQQLDWKDFEDLVDMVFTAGGWRRIGGIGGTEKDIDLELQQPVTGELVMVQVKSKCSPQLVREISESNSRKTQYKQIFVVTHSFDGKIPVDGVDARLRVVDVHELANLVLDAGLTGWVIEKSK
jgi:hypothetical protein